MKIRLTLLLFLFAKVTFSQNLIPDPGFELIKGCPKLYEFDSLVYWKKSSSKDKDPTNTSEYGLLYHKCGGRVPQTDWGYYDTHSGDGMVSIVAYFIYTKLKEPLIKGKSYRCSFWLKVGSKKNIGCWWQTYDDKISLFTFKDQPLDTILGPIRQTPAYVWSVTEPHDTSWIRFETCYKATGDDAYIGFGYKNTLLSLDCDQQTGSATEYRPPFLSVTKENAFRQLPFFIDDVELELSEDITLPTLELVEFLCKDSTVILNKSSYAERRTKDNSTIYKWCTKARTPSIEVKKPGRYSLLEQYGCTKKPVNYLVERKNCFCDFYVPNSFSPNGDNINDVFKPNLGCLDASIIQYELSIFNRWGNLVFQTNDVSTAWDGSYKNKQLSNDIYLWTIRYSIKIGKVTQEYVESGDVTLF